MSAPQPPPQPADTDAARVLAQRLAGVGDMIRPMRAQRNALAEQEKMLLMRATTMLPPLFTIHSLDTPFTSRSIVRLLRSELLSARAAIEASVPGGVAAMQYTLRSREVRDYRTLKPDELMQLVVPQERDASVDVHIHGARLAVQRVILVKATFLARGLPLVHAVAPFATTAQAGPAVVRLRQALTQATDAGEVTCSVRVAEGCLADANPLFRDAYAESEAAVFSELLASMSDAIAISARQIPN